MTKTATPGQRIALLSFLALACFAGAVREIVPDVSDQYSEGFERAEYARYWEPKMRGLHAFQIDCALRAIEEIGELLQRLVA